MIVLKLTKEIENDIRQAGAAAYPNECCGIMFGSEDGDDHVVKSLRPIVNARESGEQYHRFLITAEEMMQAELEARRLGLEIVGFYHSHPDHPAKPSDYDRFLKNARAILGFDARDALPEIGCPTLILAGEEDRIVGAAASRTLHEGIPGSELFVYPGLGHAAYEEAKDFNRRVLAFLEG